MIGLKSSSFGEKMKNSRRKEEKKLEFDNEISLDFIDKQLTSYSKLLKSGIIEAATGRDEDK